MTTAKKTAKPRRPRSKPAEPLPTPDLAADAAEAPEQPPAAKGVFVSKGVSDDGVIGVEVHLVGVEATEVQTLLELGVANFRKVNGLPPLA